MPRALGAGPRSGTEPTANDQPSSRHSEAARGARLRLGGAVAALAALLLVAPDPAACVATLREPAPAADPTLPLVALLALLAWGLAAWLVLAVLLAAAARLPGAAGHLGRRLLRLTVPLAVRRALELSLGLAVGAGVLAAPAAAATPPHPPAATATASSSPGAVAEAGVDLDWPALRAQAPAPSAPVTTPPTPVSGSPSPAVATPAPATAAPTTPAPTTPAPVQPITRPATTPAPVRPVTVPALPSEPGAGAVVVRPGDSLWALAEAGLRAAGGPTPGDAAVARAWPAWWAANREVVGDDPDLLRPGTRLVPPPA